MSKTFVYDRFDMRLRYVGYGDPLMDEIGSTDGEYVLAEDAINREAVLQAHIRTLEVQLKDARANPLQKIGYMHPDAYRRIKTGDPSSCRSKTYGEPEELVLYAKVKEASC
jgi:hypothetical protein